MKKITIFALGHKTVEINKEALKMDTINPKSSFSIGSVAHGGCTIIVENVENKELKKELLNLQDRLKIENGHSLITACVN